MDKNIVKDKIGLKKVLELDGGASYSKVSKILAKIGDKKAQELGIIPKIHSYNGIKRLFRKAEVLAWMER